MCKSGGLFLPVAFLVFGCATVNYIGNSFDPTTSVDMYFSEEEITQEYTVIGHALGSMLGWGSEDSEEIRAKLIEVAQLKGADAILITGIGKDNFFMGGSSSAEIQIDALFLKYK
ncbi:MAG: hypothetical protein JSU61_13700 [Fidelibacterota bacterium]|nr:MAG: hypothetical protein JSU61_13700 [Candidatus Neomarinimicrobiota bacterium]